MSDAEPLKYISHVCERTAAKLYIYSEAETCVGITALLGIEPTETQERSQEWPVFLGSGEGNSSALWILSSESFLESADFEEHLDWLLARIVPGKSAILQLQEREGFRMAIRCVWWSMYGHGGPVLRPDQMGLIADMNLEWSVDVGFLETTL